MAGKPGKSGGARVGCGRKKKEPVKIELEIGQVIKYDPKLFLLDAMTNPDLEARLRIDAAKSLMPFMYVKKGEGGKKDIKQEEAKSAGRGRFQATAAPRLVVNNK